MAVTLFIVGPIGNFTALVSLAILLVQRAIVILEEWVADKESYFRKKFYTVILPFVKK